MKISCQCGSICSGHMCLFGARQSVPVKVAGGSKDGISKKSKHKEAKKQIDARVLERIVSDSLAMLEIEKKRFTTVKEEFNRLVKLGYRNERVLELHSQVGPLYYRIIELYQQYVSESVDRRSETRVTLASIRTQYKKAKRKLIETEKEYEKQTKESARLVKRWQSLKQKGEDEVPKRESANRLSRKEVDYLREQSLLYKTLSDDADQDRVKYNELKDRVKQQSEHRSVLKGQKKLLAQQLAVLDVEISSNRNRLAKFKNTNLYLTKPLEQSSSLEVEHNVSLEIDILEEADADADAEDDGILSETEESQNIFNRMDNVRERLVEGDYTSLREEFNKKHDEMFLEPLIRMYSRRQQRVIEQQSVAYMALLIDGRSEMIATLFDMLIEQVSIEKMETEIDRLEPSLVIPDRTKKLERLVRREPLLNRIVLLAAISRFIYDEEDDLAQEDEEDIGPALVVERIKTLKEQEEEAEAIFTSQVLLSPYELTDVSQPEYDSLRACIYRGVDKESREPVLLKITSIASVERQVTQLLTQIEGFSHLLELFELPHFPSSFLTPCQLVENRSQPIDVYIFRELPVAFSDAMPKLSQEDKFCVLFEILEALRLAKLNYGIEYNNLSLSNIRFASTTTTDKQVRVYPSHDIQCQSAYRVSLFDFSFATIDAQMTQENRLLLANEDYHAFSNLITLKEMQITPEITTSLTNALLLATTTDKWPKESIPFEYLMDILEAEVHK